MDVHTHIHTHTHTHATPRNTLTVPNGISLTSTEVLLGTVVPSREHWQFDGSVKDTVRSCEVCFMLVRKNTTDSSLAWYTLIVDTRTTPSCVLSCEEGGEREDVGDNECGQDRGLAAGEHGVLCGVSVYSASTKCVKWACAIAPHTTCCACNMHTASFECIAPVTAHPADSQALITQKHLWQDAPKQSPL